MYFRWWLLFSSIQFNFKMHLFDGVHTQFCWTSVNIIVTDHRLLEPWGFLVRYFTETFLFKNNFKLNHHHMSLYTCIYFVLFLFCSLLFLQFRSVLFFLVANYFGWLVGNWLVGIRYVMLLLLFSSPKILPF